MAGPGNNGGDGLVAGRHLKLFGYETVHILYPKRSNKQPHYDKLVIQCQDVGVEFINGDEIPKKKKGEGEGDGGDEEYECEFEYYDAIIDSIFGFSFQGVPREPFATILNDMMTMQKQQQKSSKTKIISVDVPSGWHVDEGDINKSNFIPDALISLTAPKNCAKLFTTGRHYVGGRFLPPHIAERYNIRMPPYPGVSQVMEVSKGTTSGSGTGGTASEDNEDDWAAQYAAYCAEKEEQIQGGAGAGPDDPPTAKDDGKDDDDDWALQYQNYCIEKEEKLAKEEAERKKERGE